MKFEGKGLDLKIELLNVNSHADSNSSGVDLENFPNFEIMTGFSERKEMNLPTKREPEIIRHFTRLSKKNYSIDTGFYPLGSCTMKYNPKINEKVARFEGIADIHPLQDESTIQGALEIMYDLQNWLKELSGLPTVSLNPAAGAHGEYTGIRLIKKAHIEKEGTARKYIIIPDSAHGTNPATASACGYQILNLPSDNKGLCNLDILKDLVKKHGKDIAGIMLTNPNTCGKFEPDVNKIADLIHEIGGYFYCDGANFNAIVGNIKPASFGVDVMHFNLHKTFSTPHGGGGPGVGPIAVSDKLAKYIPIPYVIKDSDCYKIVRENKDSIGQIKGFYGQFALMVRALCYMKANGGNGFKKVSADAVLSANYIMVKLKKYYHLPFEGYCMHECLFTDKFQKKKNITTLDIAKALIEYGFHPMTMYFPLTVQGAMLIEPTETENKTTIDKFIETMIYIAKKVDKGDIEELKSFPISTPCKKLDETKAARQPILTWQQLENSKKNSDKVSK